MFKWPVLYLFQLLKLRNDSTMKLRVCIVRMYKSHYSHFLIFFCKAGCEVNKQAAQSGLSSQCHSHNQDMSLSTLSSQLNTVTTRSSLAAMVMWPNIALLGGLHMETEIAMLWQICVGCVSLPGKCLNKIFDENFDIVTCIGSNNQLITVLLYIQSCTFILYFLFMLLLADT